MIAQDALLNECCAVAEGIGNWNLGATAITIFGELARLRGDYNRAARYYEEALDVARLHGSQSLKVISIGPLLYVSLAQGDYQRAAVRFVDVVSVGREFGDETTQAWALKAMAGVVARQGHPEHAAKLFGAADASLERFGYVQVPADRVDLEREMQFIRGALAEEAYEAAHAEGRALSLHEAVDSALIHARTLCS